MSENQGKDALKDSFNKLLEDNNTQSINTNNNDTDIQGSAQDSNKRSIDEFGMVQDSELPKNNNLNTEIKS